MTSTLSTSFYIGNIRIGTIEEASVFSIGNNFLEDFESRSKHNQGLGNIHDKNVFPRAGAVLNDYERLPKLDQNNFPKMG